MQQEQTQRRVPRVRLAQPVLQHGRRRHQQRGAEQPRRVQGRQQRHHLHRLAQSHLVPDHAAHTLLLQLPQPPQAHPLVRKQLAVHQTRHRQPPGQLHVRHWHLLVVARLPAARGCRLGRRRPRDLVVVRSCARLHLVPLPVVVRGPATARAARSARPRSRRARRGGSRHAATAAALLAAPRRGPVLVFHRNARPRNGRALRPRRRLLQTPIHVRVHERRVVALQLSRAHRAHGPGLVAARLDPAPLPRASAARRGRGRARRVALWGRWPGRRAASGGDAQVAQNSGLAAGHGDGRGNDEFTAPRASSVLQGFADGPGVPVQLALGGLQRSDEPGAHLRVQRLAGRFLGRAAALRRRPVCVSRIRTVVLHLHVVQAELPGRGVGAEAQQAPQQLDLQAQGVVRHRAGPSAAAAPFLVLSRHLGPLRQQPAQHGLHRRGRRRGAQTSRFLLHVGLRAPKHRRLHRRRLDRPHAVQVILAARLPCARHGAELRSRRKQHAHWRARSAK